MMIHCIFMCLDYADNIFNIVGIGKQVSKEGIKIEAVNYFFSQSILRTKTDNRNMFYNYYRNVYNRTNCVVLNYRTIIFNII